MVGTAPAIVGRSPSMSLTSGAGCKYRSGMISDAPAMTAA